MKRVGGRIAVFKVRQPPSGGCVLKLGIGKAGMLPCVPAAFRRLCVETCASRITSEIRRASRLQAAVC